MSVMQFVLAALQDCSVCNGIMFANFRIFS